jgi:hypothetical protein
MHFQIYIPGQPDVTGSLEKVGGRPDFVANAEAITAPAGPDGQAGAIFAWWNRQDRHIGYQPERQEWIKSPNGYWVGFWKDDPPSPEQLARPYQERGKFVTLGDGNRWLVPEVHEIDRHLVLADDGTWKYEVQRQHHKLWLESLSWAERFAGASPGTRVVLDMTLLIGFVVAVLRLNYRLVPEVVSHLRLLTRHGIAQPFSVILGCDVTSMTSE